MYEVTWYRLYLMSWDGKVGICTAGNPMPVLNYYIYTERPEQIYDDILKVEIMPLNDKMGWLTNVLTRFYTYDTIVLRLNS
jgi:hypothetical protein